MSKTPSFSPAASDDVALAAADMSRLDRARLSLAMPFFKVGILLVPPTLADAMSDHQITPADES